MTRRQSEVLAALRAAGTVKVAPLARKARIKIGGAYSGVLVQVLDDLVSLGFAKMVWEKSPRHGVTSVVYTPVETDRE